MIRVKSQSGAVTPDINAIRSTQQRLGPSQRVFNATSRGPPGSNQNPNLRLISTTHNSYDDNVSFGCSANS